MQFPYSFWARRGPIRAGGGSTPTGLLYGLTAYFGFNDYDGASIPTGFNNSLPTNYYLRITPNANVFEGAGKGTGYCHWTCPDDYSSTVYGYTTDASGGSDLRLGSNRTIAFWFQTSTNGNNRFVSKDTVGNDGAASTYPEYRCEYSGGYFRFYVFPKDASISANNAAWQFNGSMFANEWHMFVGVYSGINNTSGRLGVQFDDQPMATYDFNYAPQGIMANSGHDAEFTVGADGVSSANTQCIHLDEVGVWNRVLTTGEISGLWNNGNGTTYPFTS